MTMSAVLLGLATWLALGLTGSLTFFGLGFGFEPRHASGGRPAQSRSPNVTSVCPEMTETYCRPSTM
jgi:hypothetical protein